MTACSRESLKTARGETRHRLAELAHADRLVLHTCGHGRRRLRKRGKDGIRPVHLAAAQDVLDRLHGKPTQPVEQLPEVDFSGLSDEELSTLNSLLSRVPGPGGAGDPARGR